MLKQMQYWRYGMRAKEEVKIKFSFNKKQQYGKPFSLSSNVRKLPKTLHVTYITFQYDAVNIWSGYKSTVPLSIFNGWCQKHQEFIKEILLLLANKRDLCSSGSTKTINTHTKHKKFKYAITSNLCSLCNFNTSPEAWSRHTHISIITWSPSTCTERMPSCVRAWSPCCARWRSLSAASLGMVNVTRTEFHGSTFATRSDSPLPEQKTFISEKKSSPEFIPIVISISTLTEQLFQIYANFFSLHTLMILLLLPLVLQPAVGFGLSNNTSPFVPINHQLSPSSHSQHLKISFHFFSPSFPVTPMTFPPNTS